MYRRALELRRRYLASDEDLEWLDMGADVIALRRGSGVMCIVNLSASDVALPPGDVLVASTPIVDGSVPPDAAAWVAGQSRHSR